MSKKVIGTVVLFMLLSVTTVLVTETNYDVEMLTTDERISFYESLDNDVLQQLFEPFMALIIYANENYGMTIVIPTPCCEFSRTAMARSMAIYDTLESFWDSLMRSRERLRVILGTSDLESAIVHAVEYGYVDNCTFMSMITRLHDVIHDTQALSKKIDLFEQGVEITEIFETIDPYASTSQP